MSETTMPAAEAAVDTGDERVSYELAFHVLPTVAEGEVSTVEDAIKRIATDAKAELGLAEAAQRFDLAYELQKMIDGKYRRFTTSYFGWIRFTAEPGAVETILAEVEALPEVLRALLVRLTRHEEAHPFFIHEALTASKPVTDIDVSETVAKAAAEEGADESATDNAADNEEASDDEAKEADDATIEASEDTATTDSSDDEEVKPSA